MAQMVKRLPTKWEIRVQSLGWEDLLEKEMATHSSILAWRIPRMEEPGRLQSMGLQRVRHDWASFTWFDTLLKYNIIRSDIYHELQAEKHKTKNSAKIITFFLNILAKTILFKSKLRWNPSSKVWTHFIMFRRHKDITKLNFAIWIYV